MKIPKFFIALKIDVVFVLLMISLILIFISGYFANKARNEFEKINKKVGKSVIIKKDTLLILDYSALSNSYILEDGRKVSIEYAEKALVHD